MLKNPLFSITVRPLALVLVLSASAPLTSYSANDKNQSKNYTVTECKTRPLHSVAVNGEGTIIYVVTTPNNKKITRLAANIKTEKGKTMLQLLLTALSSNPPLNVGAKYFPGIRNCDQTNLLTPATFIWISVTPDTRLR